MNALFCKLYAFFVVAKIVIRVVIQSTIHSQGFGCWLIQNIGENSFLSLENKIQYLENQNLLVLLYEHKSRNFTINKILIMHG